MRLFILVFLGLWLDSVRLTAQNQALSLDGLGSHVRLPDGLFDRLEEGTVEFWVNWADLGNFSPALILGESGRCLGFNHEGVSSNLQFFVYSSYKDLKLIKIPKIIQTQRWMHLAGVFGSEGMKLYINGTLVGENDYRGGFGLFNENSPSILGGTDHPQNQPFKGMIDEVRIWNHARDPGDIRNKMGTGLNGDEAGLIGYWNFDRGDASDGAQFKKDGELSENAICIPVELPTPGNIERPVEVSGRVLDSLGNPVGGALIHVFHNTRLVGGNSQTDSAGHFKFQCLLSDRTYDVRASIGEQSDWLTAATLEQLRRPAMFRLKPVGRISGTLHALDGTAHASHLVQAVREGVVMDTAFTDLRGRYSMIDLPPGSYRIRREGSSGFSYFERNAVGNVETGQEGDLLEFGVGETRMGLDFQFAPYRKGLWKRFSDFETGLAMGRISSISSVSDGSLWFLSGVAGICRFDGRQFTSFTEADGLPSSRILAMDIDQAGIARVGTELGVVLQLDGDGQFRTMVARSHGIGIVSALLYDSKGILQIGNLNPNVIRATYNVGIAGRYNGIRYEAIPILKDVLTWHEDPKYGLWAGTHGFGAFREVGGSWIHYGIGDGLPSPNVHCMASDDQGFLWFGTNWGLTRYDGESFRNYGPDEGLGDRHVEAIHADEEGILWLGTAGGLVRFDGKHFVHYRQMADVNSPLVTSVYRDSLGLVWCGTDQDGLLRFDPDSIAQYGAPDGLDDPIVTSLASDAEGRFLIGTDRSGILQWEDNDFRPVEGNEGLVGLRVGEMRLSPAGDLWTAVEQYTRFKFADDHANRIRVSSSTLAILPLPNEVVLSGSTISLTERTPDSEGQLTYSSSEDINQIFNFAFDARGNVWCARSRLGIAVYHDGLFNRLTTEQGLINDWVETLFVDREGGVWVGTQGGLSRFEYPDPAPAEVPLPKPFENVQWSEENRIRGNWKSYTTRDGLAHDWVKVLFQDRRGAIWVGTNGRGVSRFDGENWMSLDVNDGLSDNYVNAIAEDAQGDMWFGTRNGLSRYRPKVSHPRLEILSIGTDRESAPISGAQPATVGARVSIQYDSIDFRTDPAKKKFQCRVYFSDEPLERDDATAPPWELASSSTEYECQLERPGTHIFEVRTFDRDLNYSETHRVTLVGVLPWSRNAWIVGPIAIGMLGMLFASVVYGSKYYGQRRQTRLLQAEMLEQEHAARESLEERNTLLEQAKRDADVAKEKADAANHAKSLFLANMSHEIRTPMNAILGYAQILERESTLGEGQIKAVSTIKRSGQHLLAMINDILDLSKIEAGKMELVLSDFNLSDLVKDVSALFETLCRQRGLQWESDIIVTMGESSPSQASPDPQLWVQGDSVKIRQVLINLLGNAIKFTTTGGLSLKVIQGESSDAKDSPASSRHHRSATQYRFEVIDTGKGILPEDQEKIFQPFAQADESAAIGGTGLGLNISRRQVELMGGRLEVESQPGQGSVFSFNLSLASASREPTQSERHTRHITGGSRIHVLGVDDVEENRDVLSLLLEGIGADVELACDGEQAVSMVENGAYDIVFMDIRMPGMSGTEACHLIAEKLGEAKPPIVAVSASVLRHEQDQYLKQGFDRFIAKPFLVEQICDCLSSLLGVSFQSTAEQSLKEKGAIDGGEEEPENWAEARLPADLLQRLRKASMAHKITAIKGCLGEMEVLGDSEKRLASHLRGLVGRFELQQVQELLDEIHEAQ